MRCRLLLQLLDLTLRGELLTIASFPELQRLLHKIWWGVDAGVSLPPTTNLYLYFLSRRPLRSLAIMSFQLLMLPFVAIAPPLQQMHFGFEQPPLDYSPRMKYFISQGFYLGFAISLTATSLPLSGAVFQHHAVRDIYLFLHAAGGLAAELLQCWRRHAPSARPGLHTPPSFHVSGPALCFLAALRLTSRIR
jgi:hypothetical protein